MRILSHPLSESCSFRSTVLLALTVSSARAAIFQRQYIDPTSPSRGISRSSTPCPGGGVSDFIPNDDLPNLDLEFTFPPLNAESLPGVLFSWNGAATDRQFKINSTNLPVDLPWTTPNFNNRHRRRHPQQHNHHPRPLFCSPGRPSPRTGRPPCPHPHRSLRLPRLPPPQPLNKAGDAYAARSPVGAQQKGRNSPF
jgi:hypothetical protein